MSLEEKINADLKTAMLKKDEAALRSLRAVKQVILLAKTSGSGVISNEEELKMHFLSFVFRFAEHHEPIKCSTIKQINYLVSCLVINPWRIHSAPFD